MSPSGWLSDLGWVALAIGFASAAAIVVDELRRRERPGIMDIVHPVTALYLGPAWLAVYARSRRSEPETETEEVALAVSHCGAGCTLGDICGEWLLFGAFGAPVLGALGSYGWEIVVDFAFAWTFGVAFQYATVGSGDESPLDRLGMAVKADTLSILAFEVGLFGWMALTHFVFFEPPLAVDTSAHWFLMQVGMAVGYATAWPVNTALVRAGVKGMHA